MPKRVVMLVIMMSLFTISASATPIDNIKSWLTNIFDSPQIDNFDKLPTELIQGTYTLKPEYISFIPFRNVAILRPDENKWYTIIINADENKIIIREYLVGDISQYYIYPTVSQLNSLKEISQNINKKGITISNRIKLIGLWYDIYKIEVLK